MVLGDVCSPALGLLVPECNVALALVNSAALVATSWLNDFSEFPHPCMRLCLGACMLLCMCLHIHRGPCPQDFFGKYIPEIAI